jgi:hypothetical protein
MNIVKFLAIVASFTFLHARNTYAQFGFDEKMETAISQVHNEVIDTGSVDTIKIASSLQAEKVNITFAAVKDPTVAIEVFAPESKPQRLNDLLGAVEFNLDQASRTLNVKSHVSLYMCGLNTLTINGNTTRQIRGSCYSKTINITLPMGSKVGVWLADKPANANAEAGIDSATLIRMIDAETFHKMEVLDKVLSSHPQMTFNPRDATKIVELFSSIFDKKDVAIKVGGRVNKGDRLAYYSLIKNDIGHFDQDEVLEALNRLP